MEAADFVGRSHAQRMGNAAGRPSTVNKPRVLGIAITPPVFKASGGVSAGIQLMKRVADRLPTDMLVMAPEAKEAQDGKLAIHYIPATNILGKTRPSGPLRSLHTLMWRADFGTWIDRLRPDIVHIHNPHPPGAFAQLASAAIKRNIPYVISTHGYVEFEDYAAAFGASAWQKPIIDRLVRKPLQSVSQGAAKMAMLSPEEVPLMTRLGIASDRLAVVTNGVDPWFLDALPEAECDKLLARFDFDRSKPLIFFVGNHTPNKGIDTLLGAAMQMKAPATIVIGGGIRSEAEHATMLHDAGYDPASGRVLFTNFLSREELKALYQRCAIFAFPSRADTLPLVLLEAMVSRSAVVSTRIGGIPYEVTEDTGILIEPGDPQALAQALDALAADPERCKLMGEAGRSRALEIFNWERSADIAVQLYHSILAGRGTKMGLGT
jgi:alpha-maltose-1-phosphate synthase